MEALVDTNVLVYRYDWRFPEKQRIAWNFLRRGAENLSVAVPHQAIVEFVAATTRPRPDLGGRPLLTREEAFRETEEILAQRQLGTNRPPRTSTTDGSPAAASPP